MKFNIWRIAAIVVIVFLGFGIWYMAELNENVNRNNLLLKKEKTDLEKKINILYTEKNSLETELSKIREEKEGLVSRISEYENENAALMSEIEKMKSDLLDLSNNIYSKEAELEELKQVIDAYKKEKSDSEERVGIFGKKEKALPQAVELEPIMVTTEEKEKKLVAKILDINKDYDFVVISAGRNDGVLEGDILFVFRGNKILGRIVVEKVAGDASIAKALYKFLRDNIEVGDRVTY